MKIVEITEKIGFVNDTDHAIERVKVAAKMCNELGNTPILYRMLEGGESRGRGASNLMIKIDNQSGERKGVKGDSHFFQKKIFAGLGVQHPTQALVKTPNNIKGFHGTNFIMIPGGKFKAYWNPEIPDLGSFEGYDEKYKTVDDGKGGSRSIMRPTDMDASEEVARAVKGYKQGIPNQSKWDGEVIVDTPFYYMLNLQEFLQKYAGKKSKELVNAPQFVRLKGPDYGEIKKDLLQAKFKTYSDLGWYLSNPTMNFLNWWKEKEVEQRGQSS
jgi:hypothetical protein